MTLRRYRWLLPVGHLIIDSIVLVLWIWRGHELLLQQAQHRSRSSMAKPILFLQDQAVTFDIRDMEPDHEFLFLAVGDMPAALVSMTARPHAHIQNRKQLSDPIWFTIHECLSFGIWFGIGILLDPDPLRLKATMMAFLAARLAFVPFLVWKSVAQLAAVLEMFFWLVLAFYAIAWVILRLLRGPSFTASPPR